MIFNGLKGFIMFIFIGLNVYNVKQRYNNLVLYRGAAKSGVVKVPLSAKRWTISVLIKQRYNNLVWYRGATKSGAVKVPVSAKQCTVLGAWLQGWL